MAHSLEVRCPLLDRRVVELAFRIPASRKQQGRRGKVLLRALAKRRLPSDLWRLPKRGFTAPIGEWVAGQHASMFREESADKCAYVGHLDMRTLNALGAEHQGQSHSRHALWEVWVLERWLRRRR